MSIGLGGRRWMVLELPLGKKCQPEKVDGHRKFDRRVRSHLYTVAQILLWLSEKGALPSEILASSKGYEVYRIWGFSTRMIIYR